MSIKLMFEIGHSAARKIKPSKEGFTHDWELFVRGASDGNDIGHFVEKVVFNLHESFPKPKRVLKEAPYVVKEAGYAGFLLTIDIYLKNRDEPKKATFEYDLDLQTYKVQMNELIITAPSDEFKKKCLKGGGVIVNSSNDHKNRDPYGKNPQMPAVNDIKKSSKRPEETKPNKQFTDLFGAPLKKPDPRSLQNSSPNPTKLPSTSIIKGNDKVPSSSTSGSKDKSEKSKHKHSPNKEGKEGKKTSEVKQDTEKSKKDKTKDRERSDKKEKVSKRPSSPSPNSTSASSSSVRNSTNLNSLPPSKGDLVKPPSKQSAPLVPVDSSFNKKSSKKDKKNDKERERNDKKESRAFTSKDKAVPEPSSSKSNSSGVKERETNPAKDDRDKSSKQAKSNPPAGAEPKTTAVEPVKKQHDKDSERKHKHKKKEKTKDKDPGKDSKKEKQHKNSTSTASLAKAKEPVVMKYEPSSKSHLSDKDSSDSDVDSPLSIKQYSDNSMSEAIIQKPPPEVEKPQKKPRERPKAADKEDKSRKSKKSKKEDRESSTSPPPSKQSRKDLSKSPSLQERPSSSDSAAHHSHANNNNIDGPGNDRKISNEYMSELKDLKHKITTLKNNDDLQHVVRLIAATGCYEITKSSFDFDLVQLDRSTVQRLQEFFTSS